MTETVHRPSLAEGRPETLLSATERPDVSEAAVPAQPGDAPRPPGRGVVVKIHESERVQVDGGVLVGDDGSPVSRAAVVWAAQDAARRGVILHVLQAWSMTSAPRPASWAPGYVPALPDWAAAVAGELASRCTDLLAGIAGVDVEVHAVHAPAAQGLIEASQGADLVVVGTRGRDGLAGLVLGSVAEQVVRHAHCPVTVVRNQFHPDPSA